MTLEDTAKLIASIGKMWPAWLEKRDIDGTIRLWQRVFADDDAQTVGQALGAFFATDTKGFAPVPGQLKEIMVSMMSDGEMTEQEAWALVSRACRNAAYNAETEFRKLPPVCQQIVGFPSVLREWSQLEADEFQTVVASNFMRSYKARSAQEREYKKLPGSIRALMPSLRIIGALPGEVTPKPEPFEPVSAIPEEARAMIEAAFKGVRK